jgi:hypothetical protein
MTKLDINIINILIIKRNIMIPKVDMSKMDIPPALLMKSNDHEISREEETTVILQVLDLDLDFDLGLFSNSWTS